MTPRAARSARTKTTRPAGGRVAAPQHAGRAPARHEELNSSWHLARDQREIAVTELEFSLMRVNAAFERWTAECLSMVAKQPLGHACAALLHVIGLKDRPKTTAEVARLLNREDIANVQYSIRKLLQAGLVERYATGRGKGGRYRVTRRGRRVSGEYAQLRAEVLMSRIPSVEHWDEQLRSVEQIIDLMRGVYDQAALVLATHRSYGDT